MERKIVLSLFYMGVITAIAGILITTLSYYGFFRKEIKENLAHECHLVAQCYESLDSAKELERFTGEDFRITLIEKDGTVRNGNNSTIGYAKDVPKAKAAVFFFFNFF